ncbi:MAG: LysR family transcriptional regulator [Rubrivivax sp.]|nr:LysR family transcriptional regulator [Rubrivivax sp.]
MNLSGRLIDAFLALEQTRRFAVAAERCHVSPSAFSQMIGRLEAQVGARLFDRDTRNVALTAEGQAFSVGAHRIADEIRATLSGVKDRAALGSGRVAIAAPPSLASDWLAAVLAEFRDAHPGVTLRLLDVVSDRCLALVAAGEVDFGLNAQRGNDLEFDSSLLFQERFHLICRGDDAFAGRRSIRLRDLRGRPFVQTVRSGSVWQQTQPWLAKAQVHDTGFEVSQFGTLAALVERGFGVSLVPATALPLCRRQGLVDVLLDERAAWRPIYRVQRRGRTLSAAAQALRRAISDGVPSALRRPASRR